MYNYPDYLGVAASLDWCHMCYNVKSCFSSFALTSCISLNQYAGFAVQLKANGIRFYSTALEPFDGAVDIEVMLKSN